MKNQRNELYIFANADNDEFIISGLQFSEFTQWIKPPIENIMLLSGECFESGINKHYFEIIEGRDNILSFSNRDIYDLGDFCFVDYERSGATDLLLPQDVAELLYLGHMFKPLTSPFISCIGNRFAYLVHDDGWFCRLFSKERRAVIDVIVEKLVSEVKRRTKQAEVSARNLYEELFPLAEKGLLIDFSGLSARSGVVEAAIYTVGLILNMDDITNGSAAEKYGGCFYGMLKYENGSWVI
ncbi:MAG: hypothetical protein LBB94_10190 [Clostridiales bacterium]|jgi:hypothetical protein|nr:hypothetical protein [Clostridiales bacterium]